jgi:hypothetical protein
MDNTVIENALENKPVKITLAGLEFEFKEPVIREERIIRASYLEMAYPYKSLMEKADKATSPAALAKKMSMKDAADELRFKNALCEWLVDVIGIKKVQRKTVIDNATDTEIIAARDTILEILNSPLSGGARSTAQAPKDTTPSPSGKVTT